MKMRFFKDWFSFSRGERQGVIVLALLVLALLLLPPLFRSCSSSRPEGDDMARLRALAARLNETSLAESRSFMSNELGRAEERPQPQTFAFNPNTLSRDSLLLLGFSAKQADAIVKYRERGSGFRTAANFLKLNVITDRQRERLQPGVTIPPAAAKKVAVRRDTVARSAYAKPKPVAVELNTADTALLRTLPGIGAYFAQKMVEYREALGGYVSTEQLLEIQNFGHERLQKLAGRIAVDVSRVQRFELSEENHELLRRHPYIGAYAARGVAQYVKRKGSPATIDELLNNNVITSLQAYKLRPYVR